MLILYSKKSRFKGTLWAEPYQQTPYSQACQIMRVRDGLPALICNVGASTQGTMIIAARFINNFRIIKSSIISTKPFIQTPQKLSFFFIGVFRLQLYFITEKIHTGVI